MTLSFNTMSKTDALLPLFRETYKKGFANGDNLTTAVGTFSKTTIRNYMMTLSKSFFNSTKYMLDDPEFGGILENYIR